MPAAFPGYSDQWVAFVRHRTSLVYSATIRHNILKLLATRDVLLFCGVTQGSSTTDEIAIEARGGERQMTNIPTDLLRTLVAVVDLRSFTKAAAALGVTQPAVSAQIKRLQFLLGGDLFDRSST